MRSLQVACWLAVVGLALVPTGCADDAGSSAGGTATTLASHAGHDGHDDRATSTVAPTTTLAPPTRLDIVAKEYEWSGLPDELPAGSYPMSFHNEGTEAHEISVFRNTENIPLEELFKLGPEGMKAKVEEAGMLISGPGTAADHEVTLELTPGEYEVVCFIPAASDTQPHFAHGMHRTLVVR